MADSSTSNGSDDEQPKPKLSLRGGRSSTGDGESKEKPTLSLTPKQRDEEPAAESGYTEPPIEAEPEKTEKKQLKLNMKLGKGSPGIRKVEPSQEGPKGENADQSLTASATPLTPPQGEDPVSPTKPKLSFKPKEPEPEPAQESTPPTSGESILSSVSQPKEEDKSSTPSDKPKLSFQPREPEPEPEPPEPDQSLTASAPSKPKLNFKPREPEPEPETAAPGPSLGADIPDTIPNIIPASPPPSEEVALDPPKKKFNLKAPAPVVQPEEPTPEEEAPAPAVNAPPPPKGKKGKKAPKPPTKGKKGTAPKEGEEKAGKSSKSKRLQVVLLVAVLASSAWFVYSQFLAGPAEEPVVAPVAAPPPVDPGPSFTVEKITTETAAEEAEVTASKLSSTTEWLEDTRFPLVKDSGDGQGIVYGRVFYPVGSLILPEFDLSLQAIDPENRLLIFADPTGRTYSKEY